MMRQARTLSAGISRGFAPLRLLSRPVFYPGICRRGGEDANRSAAYNFDAAIIFSDILVIPYALSREVRFEAGEGQRLDPLGYAGQCRTLAAREDFTKLEPVYEALAPCVVRELDPNICMIGL